MERPRWIRVLAWLWGPSLGRFALILLALAGAAALALLPAHVLKSEFDGLERAALQRDVQRVQEGVRGELQVLEDLARDWGIWDDAYAFVADRTPAFEKANLEWGSLLGSTHIHLIYFLDNKGTIVWGGFHPKDAAHVVALPALAQDRIRSLPLLAPPGDGPRSGLFLTSEGPLLLVAQPIMTSQNQGPTRGTLLMGRLLDQDHLDSLSHRLAIPFSARDTLRDPLDPGDASTWAAEGWATRIRNQTEERMDLLCTLPDMYGTNRIVFTLPWERAIHVQGQRAGRFVFGSLFLAILVVAGALVAAFLHHLDMTRRYQASLEEEVSRRTSELRGAERRFRAFIDHTHDLMFWCRLRAPEGPFVLEGVNPAALQFTKLPLDGVLGHQPHECLPASIAERLEFHLRDCASRAEPLVIEDTFEVEGARMIFQTALVPVPDETGRVSLVAGSSRDITALREREEGLLHTQKLESLGVLAGGIAHDFNNILTAALGNLDICSLFLPEGTEALPHFENIRIALTKAANLTRQMLAYSGRGRFVLQIHDLNEAVREMMALLEISINKKATLVCELADRLPPLEADVTQIQQVIMNLVTNASDALQDRGGVIRVRTQAAVLDREAIACLPIRFMSPGLHVALEVTDTGSGMTPEVQARIFEPFFSTKGAGRGLGLSAMLGILRSHRGGLALESVVGKGTTFTLWFPVSSQPHELPIAEEASTRHDVMPKGALLYVEDDPSVRGTTARLLRNQGFSVIEAEDGLEGMECFFTHRAEITLIILDLTMPRMDGREFLAELRPHAPALPVIVSSGYTEQELPAGDPALSFLQKPYQISELRAAIFKALERSC